MIGGPCVLRFEVVLIGDLGEIDPADVEKIGLVRRGREVGSELAVEIVEASGNGVVSSDHCLHYIIMVVG